MILASEQRRLDVLRDSGGGGGSLWRDLRVWLAKEECRRRVGVDPDFARMVGRGFGDGKGYYQLDVGVRIVRGGAYAALVGFGVVLGWMRWLERVVRRPVRFVMDFCEMVDGAVAYLALIGILAVGGWKRCLEREMRPGTLDYPPRTRKLQTRQSGFRRMLCASTDLLVVGVGVAILLMCC